MSCFDEEPGPLEERCCGGVTYQCCEHDGHVGECRDSTAFRIAALVAEVAELKARGDTWQRQARETGLMLAHARVRWRLAMAHPMGGEWVDMDRIEDFYVWGPLLGWLLLGRIGAAADMVQAKDPLYRAPTADPRQLDLGEWE